MLRRDWHEATVWIIGCARMATVLKHSRRKKCFYQACREEVPQAVRRQHLDACHCDALVVSVWKVESHASLKLGGSHSHHINKVFNLECFWAVGEA